MLTRAPNSVWSRTHTHTHCHTHLLHNYTIYTRPFTNTHTLTRAQHRLPVDSFELHAYEESFAAFFVFLLLLLFQNGRVPREVGDAADVVVVVVAS